MTIPAQTSLADRLSLSEVDMQIVHDILQMVLPGREVWAFGSRATRSRMLKRFSDLDLAVEGQLTWTERAELAEAFDESLLPVKVDVVELGLVDADFRERIEKDFMVVQSG
jgi:predicted nucleotidyltransferase